jgi:hypothetical protein
MDVMWLLVSGDISWIATTGLVVILVVLFLGGLVLLVFGARDLVHDFRHHLHPR